MVYNTMDTDRDGSVIVAHESYDVHSRKGDLNPYRILHFYGLALRSGNTGLQNCLICSIFGIEYRTGAYPNPQLLTQKGTRHMYIHIYDVLPAQCH